jgi:hypothetical protein
LTKNRDARARWGARLGLLAISVGFVFIIAEIGGRIVWASRMQMIEEARQGGRRHAPEKWAHLPRLRGLFALARPNLRGTTAGVLFETNGLGFRGPDRMIEKPQGVTRIAVIGDSIAMGFGTLYANTYAVRIEDALNARGAESAEPTESGERRRFEVINVGLSGLNTGAAVNRFEDLALRFDPDLVIYGYTLNDIEGEHYRSNYGRKKRDIARMRESPSHAWRVLGPRWRSLIDLFFAPEGSYEFELRENYFRNDAAWAEVGAGLDRLAEVAEERGICVLVLVHTRLEALNWFHPYHDFYDAVVRSAEERGFSVVRSFEEHRGREATNLWVTAFDSHPNANGHALLAKAALRGLDAMPAECR